MAADKDASPENQYFLIDHLKKNLKERTVRGGIVTLGSQFIKFVLTLITTAVLARLLTPDEHGLILMVVPIIGLISLFKDLGLSQATVQKADITHSQISMLFWVNLTFSIVLMVVIALASPLVAWFYGKPELTGVTVAIALGFLIGGLTVQHQALLRRQMRFHILAVIEITASLAGLIAGIVSALYGLGYWALVIKMLVTAAVNEAGVWIACGWRPGLPRLGSGAFSMITFGIHITGFNILNYFSVNMANVLIGKFCGVAQVGFYGRARQLLLLPIQQINAPLSSVVISSLSRLADEPEAYRRAYVGILEKIAMVIMPCVAALIVSADWVIMLILGPQWTEAVRIFALLGIAAFLIPVGNTVGWLFITQGRTRHMFQWGIIDGVITIVAISAGLPWGVTGVAACYAVSSVCLRIPLLFWFIGRTGPVRARDFYRTISAPVFASLCLLIVLTAFRRLIQVDLFTGIAATLGISAVVTMTLYLILPATRTALKDFREIAAVLVNRKKTEE